MKVPWRDNRYWPLKSSREIDIFLTGFWIGAFVAGIFVGASAK